MQAFFGGTIPASSSPLPTYINTFTSPASRVPGLSEPRRGWVRRAAGRLPHTPGPRNTVHPAVVATTPGPCPATAHTPPRSGRRPHSPPIAQPAPGADIPQRPGRRAVQLPQAPHASQQAVRAYNSHHAPRDDAPAFLTLRGRRFRPLFQTRSGKTAQARCDLGGSAAAGPEEPPVARGTPRAYWLSLGRSGRLLVLPTCGGGFARDRKAFRGGRERKGRGSPAADSRPRGDERGPPPRPSPPPGPAGISPPTIFVASGAHHLALARPRLHQGGSAPRFSLFGYFPVWEAGREKGTSAVSTWGPQKTHSANICVLFCGGACFRTVQSGCFCGVWEV